jgi:4-amino-4-deoxy-L-arabinose transferase-like glycosyltransferase
VLQRSERNEVGRRPGSAARLVPWLAILAYTIVGLVFWVDRQWHLEWDSATYLLTGKSLAAGEGYLYLGQPFFLRPPGFAWILSLLVRDGAYDFLTLNRMVMLFAGATVAAIYVVLRGPYGRWTAISVALVSGTSPLFVADINWVMSDFPFAALFFSSVALLDRAGERGERWWAWALGGVVALAASIYMRAAGILVLPAMLLLGIGRDRGVERWRAVAPVVLVVLLVLPWGLYARNAARAVPQPSEQLLNFDYTTSVFHVDPGDPGSPLVSASGWIERVGNNGGNLARDVAATCLWFGGPLAKLLTAALLLSGFILAVRRRPTLLDGFAVVYGLVVLTYFTYDLRLLMPLVPMIYLYFFLAISAAARAIGRRVRSERPVGVAFASVFALLLVANFARLPAFLHPERRVVGGITQEQYWDDTRTLAAWISENTPEDEVILAYEAPVLSVLSGRRTYTYRYARGPGLLDRYETDRVVLYPGGPRDLREEVERRAAEVSRVPVPSRREPVPIYRLDRSAP